MYTQLMFAVNTISLSILVFLSDSVPSIDTWLIEN